MSALQILTPSIILMFHPLALGVIAIFVIGMFVPHFLGPIGRLLGRTARRNIERRIGFFPKVKLDTKQAAPPKPAQAVPLQPIQPLETELTEASIEEIQSEISPRRSSVSAYLWTIGIGVSAIVCVLLWILLQSH